MKPSSQDSIVSLILPLSLILGFVLLLSLEVDPGDRQLEIAPIASSLKTVIDYLAATAEIAAAGVISIGVIRGILMYLRQLLSRSNQHIDTTERIRLQLGRVLVLGLEFSVASDILRTAVAPDRNDLLNLGAIVLLRTLLNYFLEREIQQVEQKRSTEIEPRY